MDIVKVKALPLAPGEMVELVYCTWLEIRRLLQVRGFESYSLRNFPFSITVVQLFLVQFVVVRIHEWELNLNYMFFIYYIICIIYCFYRLNIKYRTRGLDYGTSPEMDSIMVLVMAWVLAPVDVSITWINMVKEAEQARINQSKFDINLSEDAID